MSPKNPFSPPQAQVEDVQDHSPRNKFGLRLGASLLWRVLVFHVVAGVPFAFAMLPMDNVVMWKPTVLFTGLAFLLAVSLLVFRSGALSLLRGHALGLNAASWRKFSWMVCWLYIALAVGNSALVLFAPVAVWLLLKLFVPLLSIIALCAIAPRFLRDVA